MYYLLHRPAEPLGTWVEKLWYCEGYPVTHRRERVLPSGKFQLVIDLSESASPPLVAGIRSEYSVIETAGLQSMIGVIFRPGGTCPFFGWPADEFYNQEIPLDLIWGGPAMRLRDRLREARTPEERFRLLDAALMERWKHLELHPAVGYALGEFQRALHIRGVLDVLPVPSLPGRRSEAYVGCSARAQAAGSVVRGGNNRLSGRGSGWRRNGLSKITWSQLERFTFLQDGRAPDLRGYGHE